MTRIVTVTGTSTSPSLAQAGALVSLLKEASALHHGVCDGADHLAHVLARGLGVPIYGHPGVDRNGMKKKRALIPDDQFAELYESRWFLDRNRDMVIVSTEVVALVREPEWYRSGEWATIRLGEKLGVPVTLVLPDGTMKGEQR